jgi:hypothetical protein
MPDARRRALSLRGCSAPAPCARAGLAGDGGAPSPARAQTLEIRTETPELLGALSTLSTFYADNTPADRRRLRATIERRGLRTNEAFLGAAEAVMQARPSGPALSRQEAAACQRRSRRVQGDGGWATVWAPSRGPIVQQRVPARACVYTAGASGSAARRLRPRLQEPAPGTRRAPARAAPQALEGVQGELDGLAEGCGRIAAALAAARGASAELLGGAERVARDLAASETRSALVGQFLAQYQLAPGEVAALQGGPVDDAFFGALERVRAIHANCRALLRTHHQRAGLELMEAMSGYQETAYERLCRCAAAPGVLRRRPRRSPAAPLRDRRPRGLGARRR